jgi:hypothetical protein
MSRCSYSLEEVSVAKDLYLSAPREFSTRVILLKLRMKWLFASKTSIHHNSRLDATHTRTELTKVFYFKNERNIAMPPTPGQS